MARREASIWKTDIKRVPGVFLRRLRETCKSPSVQYFGNERKLFLRLKDRFLHNKGKGKSIRNGQRITIHPAKAFACEAALCEGIEEFWRVCKFYGGEALWSLNNRIWYNKPGNFIEERKRKEKRYSPLSKKFGVKTLEIIRGGSLRELIEGYRAREIFLEKAKIFNREDFLAYYLPAIASYRDDPIYVMFYSGKRHVILELKKPFTDESLDEIITSEIEKLLQGDISMIDTNEIKRKRKADGTILPGVKIRYQGDLSSIVAGAYFDNAGYFPKNLDPEMRKKYLFLLLFVIFKSYSCEKVSPRERPVYMSAFNYPKWKHMRTYIKLDDIPVGQFIEELGDYLIRTEKLSKAL